MPLVAQVHGHMQMQNMGVRKGHKSTWAYTMVGVTQGATVDMYMIIVKTLFGVHKK